MTLLSALVLAAATAWAAAPVQVAEPPPLPRPAMPSAAAVTAIETAVPAEALIAPRTDGTWLSRDVTRNERLSQLARAGARAFLADKGLVLWHLTPYQARGVDKLQLVLSLFDGRAPVPAVEAAVGRHEDAVRAFVAQATGLSGDNILIGALPLKQCCGGGCGDCLHSKKGPSRYWTKPPHGKK